MTTAGAATPADALWAERLRLLRELYAVGLRILSERVEPGEPQLSPSWALIDRHWEAFTALDAQLREAPPPTDPTLRRALLDQAQKNADLYRSLERHCRALQNDVTSILMQLHQMPRGNDLTRPPSQVVHTEA